LSFVFVNVKFHDTHSANRFEYASTMIPPAATPGKGREGKDYARGNSYWYGVQGCDLKGGRRRRIADNDVQGLMLVLATVPLVACESLRPPEALPSAPVATSTDKPAAKSAQKSSISAPTSAPPITDSASPSAASIVPQAERTSPAASSPEPSSRPLPSRETANKATEKRTPATATTTAAVSSAAEKSVAELSGPSSQSSASSRSTSRPLPSAASSSSSSSVAAPPHLYSPSPPSPPLVSQPKIITKSNAAVTADSSASGEDYSLFDCEQSYSSSSEDQVQTTLIIVFSFRSPIASMADIILDIGSSNRTIRLQHNDKATTVQLFSSIHADSIQAKFSKKKNQLKVQGVCA
jgi:hypothetical protein